MMAPTLGPVRAVAAPQGGAAGLGAALRPAGSRLVSIDLGPGLQRYPVGEQQAAARGAVGDLHYYADFFSCDAPLDVADFVARPSLKETLRNAAVLLDDYRAGSALEAPHPKSGWVLVPATVLPKARAAIEALLAQMEQFESLPGDDENGWDAAIAGGRSVLAVIEALEAQP